MRDLAERRVGRVGGDACPLQRDGVAPHGVVVPGAQHHRAGRGRRRRASARRTGRPAPCCSRRRRRRSTRRRGARRRMSLPQRRSRRPTCTAAPAVRRPQGRLAADGRARRRTTASGSRRRGRRPRRPLRVRVPRRRRPARRRRPPAARRSSGRRHRSRSFRHRKSSKPSRDTYDTNPPRRLAPNTGCGTHAPIRTLDRRHRQRRSRPGRRLCAVGARPGHPLRGRHPARRARPHPLRRPGRRLHRRRRHAPSSCTTTAPTRRCAGCSTNWASPPGRPTCRCRCATTAAGWSTRAPAASAGCSRRWSTLARPRYLLMLAEVKRFHAAATRLLDTTRSDDETLGAFLDRHGFSPYFVDHFMTPLVAAVWSCPPGEAMRYPARYLFVFLEHHGMLSVFGSPTWRTVVGGSANYVEAIVDADRRGARGHAGALGAAGPRRRCRSRPAMRSAPVRRRRHRHASRSGAADARRTDRRRARRARRHPLLHQPRTAAHRRIGAAAASPGPRVVELPGAPPTTTACWSPTT